MSYTFGFYRVSEPLTDVVERETLKALEQLSEGFFPAGLWVSRKEKLLLPDASSYTRSLVPKKYFISPGIAILPLEAKNGTTVVFTESDAPELYPASLVFECSLETLQANGWGIRNLCRILHETVKGFCPDYAYLYANAQRARDSYGKTMFEFDMRQVPIGIFWINYYGPQWVENVGAATMGKIKELVPRFEVLENGGALFAIQEEPYREENPAHRQHQIWLEEALGLKAIQSRFPNRGMGSKLTRSR